jgi:hypothetical protein
MSSIVLGNIGQLPERNLPMSNPLPTKDDTFCGYQTALQRFKLKEVIAAITVDGVEYFLIYGTHVDQLDQELKQTYAVVCRDDLFGWRTVLLRLQGDTVGYNYLTGQGNPPRFHGLNAHQADVAFDLEYHGKIQLVLRPYRLPVAINEDGVTAVGQPLFFGDNRSGIVPVQFTDGYGLLFCRGDSYKIFQSPNNEVNDLLKCSKTMPTIQNGLGLNTWHVMVTERGQDVLLKLFHNGKGMRRLDEVNR